MNLPHVDTILVKNYYEFFSENLGIEKLKKKKCKLYVEMVKYGYVKKAHQTSKMANQGP